MLPLVLPRVETGGERIYSPSPLVDSMLIEAPCTAHEPLGRVVVVPEQFDQAVHNLSFASCAEPSEIHAE